ncbi:MAG TPA: methionine--tRNA ligase [Thermomicrobiales bacterium]|nr:methionine--tRNA ligase [Thermomicrobiales bacterium]
MPPSGQSATYYLTAAIDYPNGAPHIGHSLEKIAADVMRRYRLLRGDDACLTMGLDENSQHIVTAARDNGVDVHVWVDRMEEVFRRAWASLDVQPDAFVRTTEPRHAAASRELFQRAQAAGDIYKSTYAGWYCPNCNAFYTDDDLVAGRCPNHPSIVPEWLEEENYFFALGKYGERLLAHMEQHPDFIMPAVRRAEVLATIHQGLRDFSVSRAVRAGTTPWGIPVPGDESQVLYVWFDALTTYLTGIGFADDYDLFERMWPAKAHVIGKDITRFHCLYWPAMLLSAGLPLPGHVVVHGFLTVDGQRISKTTGNVVDPVEITAEFGADPVRYYLMRDVSFASDGDFSRTTLIRRHNDDLANDLGNLLNRVVSMVGRYRQGEVPEAGAPGDLERDLQRVAEQARGQAEAAFDAWALDRALDAIWTLVRRSNQYLEERQPWKLAKDEAQRPVLDTTLASAAEAMRLIAIYLAPFIPTTADRIMAQLGLPPVAQNDWVGAGTWGARTTTRVVPAEPLFPKIEATGS